MFNVKRTAQVACEAIVNVDGDGYEISTMQDVLDTAIANEVSQMYTDLLVEVIDRAVTRRDDAERI